MESGFLPPYVNHDRLRRPGQHPSVRRPRLLRQLRLLPHAKLALLYAEAGYGKTTLMLDYLAECSLPVVWYSLEESDRDVLWFVSHLAEGLSQRILGLGAELGEALSRGQMHSASELRHLVQHEISVHVRDPLLIALDNLEAVATSQGVCRLLSALLQQSGPELHFLVASRVMPPIPLGRLALDGEVMVLGASELAFTQEEAREHLSRVHGLAPSDGQFAALWRHTLGWPAGLTMFAQSIRGKGLDPIVSALKREKHLPDQVYQYFDDEVLDHQSSRARDFLMRTSILPRLHAETINELLGIEDAGAQLAVLRSKGVFVSHSQGDGDDLAYHPMFRSFLLDKLRERHNADYVKDLYRRAAETAQQRGDWTEAIEQYARIEAWEDVGKIVEKVGEELSGRGLLETIRAWLNPVPEGQVAERPKLLVLRGRLLRLAGLYPEALVRLETAFEVLRHQENQADAVVALHEIAVCRYWMGQFLEADLALADALDRASSGDAELRCKILADLTRNCVGSDDLEKAKEWGERAEAASVAGWGQSGARSLSRSLRFHGHALLVLGELDQGMEKLRRALELCDSEDVGDLQRAWCLSSLGEGLTLRGLPVEARCAFDESERLSHGNQSLLQRIRLWRGIAHRDTGDFEGAERDLVSAAQEGYRELGFLRLRQGRFGEALRLSEAGRLRFPPGQSPGRRAACDVVYGVALARAVDLSSGLGELAAAAEVLRQRGRQHQLASAGWHLARLFLEDGQEDRAMTQLKSTVLWSSGAGLLHWWWWDPETVARLWPLAVASGWATTFLMDVARLRLGPEQYHLLYQALDLVGPELRARVEDTLAAVSQQVVGRDLTEDLLHGCRDEAARRRIRRAMGSGVLGLQDLARLRSNAGLTWREIDVFVAYYLCLARSDERAQHRRQLAESLALSEHTLKVHIQNLRKKLPLPDRRRGSPWPPSLPIPTTPASSLNPPAATAYPDSTPSHLRKY